MIASHARNVVTPRVLGPCGLIALAYGLLLVVRPMVATVTTVSLLIAGYAWLAFVLRRARGNAGVTRRVALIAIGVLGAAAFGLLGFVSKVGFGGLCQLAAITWLPLGASLVRGPERGFNVAGVAAFTGGLLLSVAGLLTVYGIIAHRAGNLEFRTAHYAIVVGWAGLAAIVVATVSMIVSPQKRSASRIDEAHSTP